MKKSFSRDVADLDAPIVRPNFIPRRGSYDIPASGSQDEPLVCFKINARWVGHFIGVFAALDQPDAWIGTPSDIEDARGEVRKVIASMESCNDVITDIRIVDCIIELFIDGVWVPKVDITACVSSIAEVVDDADYRDRPWDEPTSEETPMAVELLDCLWGGSLSAARYVMRVAAQAADLIEVAADATDAAGDFLTTIPGFSTAPSAKILSGMQLGFALTVAVIRQAFIQEVEDIIACQLFCIVRAANNGNTLNDDLLEQWYDAMGAKSSETPLSIWSPGLGFITDVARNIVGRRYTYQQFLLGLNDCSDDWMILCVDCPDPDWCYNFDFTLGDGGWERIPRALSNTGFEGGVYSSSVGWLATQQWDGTTPTSNKTTSVAIKLPISPETKVTNITLEYDFLGGTFKAGTVELKRPEVGYNGSFTYIFDDASVPGLNEITTVVDWDATEVRIRLRSSVLNYPDNTSPTGSITLSRIRLRGQGDNPVGTDNC